MWLNKKYFFVAFFLFFLSLCFLISYKNKNQTKWWQISTHGEIFLSPVIDKNNVYWANNLGEVSAINKKTGKLLWNTSLQARDPYSLSGFGDEIFALMPSGRLIAISTETGQPLWTFSTDNQASLSAYFHIKNNVMYINSSDAVVYAIDIKDGSLLWKFVSQLRIESNSTESMGLNLFGKLESYKNKLVFSSVDGFVYMISPKDGSIIWQSKIDQLSTAMQIKGKILYIGKESGEIIGLRLRDGKNIYSNSTNKNQVMCFREISIFQDLLRSFSFANLKHIFNYPLLLITKNGKFFATKNDLSSFDEMFDLNAKLNDCPQIINNYGYAFAKNGSAYSFNPHKKSSNDYGQIDDIFLFSPKFVEYLHIPIFTGLFTKYELGTLVSDFTGGFSLLKNSNGKKKWSYSSIGKVVSEPKIDGNFVYFTDTDGRLSRILTKSGRIPVLREKKSFKVEQKTLAVGSSQAYEFTATHDEFKFPNAWSQISVQAMFSHKETGTNVTINGFYYDKNTWKLRFNPPLSGEWNWNLIMKFPDGFQYQKPGTLTAITDTKNKYIKISQQNHSRFTLDNETEFVQIGFQDAVRDFNKNGSNLDDWSLEERAPGSSYIVDLFKYLDEYGKNGKRFNTYRFGVNNASFDLFDRLYVGAQPAVENAKMLDNLFAGLQNNSFHIWMSLFSFYLNEKPVMIEKNFLDEYIKYIVARYGVYIDVWEIGNEIKISDKDAEHYSDLIKSLDYEKRLVTTSWEKPTLDKIEIISLHRYDSDSPRKTDLNLLKITNQYADLSKPIVFSEMGNVNSSWENDSLDRMRVKIWTGLFNDLSFIFWNTVDSKEYYNPLMKNGNLYIGNDERQQIEVFNSFTHNIPLNSIKSRISTSDSSVRGYGISTDNGELGYFICDYPKINVIIGNLAKRNGVVEWINPKTGELISKKNINSFDRILELPPCDLDLVMRLSY